MCRLPTFVLLWFAGLIFYAGHQCGLVVRDRCVPAVPPVCRRHWSVANLRADAFRTMLRRIKTRVGLRDERFGFARDGYFPSGTSYFVRS